MVLFVFFFSSFLFFWGEGRLSRGEIVQWENKISGCHWSLLCNRPRLNCRCSLFCEGHIPDQKSFTSQLGIANILSWLGNGYLSSSTFYPVSVSGQSIHFCERMISQKMGAFCCFSASAFFSVNLNSVAKQCIQGVVLSPWSLCTTWRCFGLLGKCGCGFS